MNFIIPQKFIFYLEINNKTYVIVDQSFLDNLTCPYCEEKLFKDGNYKRTLIIDFNEMILYVPRVACRNHNCPFMTSNKNSVAHKHSPVFKLKLPIVQKYHRIILKDELKGILFKTNDHKIKYENFCELKKQFVRKDKDFKLINPFLHHKHSSSFIFKFIESASIFFKLCVEPTAMVLSCGKKLFNLPIGKNAKTDCAPLSKLEFISRALNNFKVPNDFDNSLFAHAFNIAPYQEVQG